MHDRGNTINDVSNESITYKTKLKLDKEVGGGDLSDLCTNVVSCKSIQFPKFRVQAQGYAIK